MMSDTKLNKSKVGMIVHIIVYTLLIGSLAGVVYLDYDHIEKEAKVLLGEEPQGEAVEEEADIDEISIMQQDELADLQERHMKLSADYNQSQMDFEDLQTERDDLEKELMDLKQKTPNQLEAAMSTKAQRVKDSASCYDMYNGSYFIDKACEKSIKNYVNRHKDARYFEIVGIVDTLEFHLLTQLEKNRKLYDTLGTSQESVNNLKKFSQTGLAKFRAMEASWVIKMHTKKKAVTYDAHYQIISKKGQRGVLIRAYK